MDKTLEGLVALVGAADVETRCAALLVLTQLEADDAKVVAAVRAALAGANVVVRDFALTYVERTRPKTALEDLVALLDNEDESLRRRAAEILATYGAAAIAAVRKRVEGEAPRRRLNAIIDVCGRVRSVAAQDLLFRIMAGGDFETNRLAGEQLENLARSLRDADKKDFFARVEAFAQEMRKQRVPLVSALKLFGALCDPRCRKRLFALLPKGEEHAVRTHALGALLQCLRGAKLPAAEIDALLALLDEDDEAGLLRPAVALLEGQSFERRHLDRFQALADSPQGVVKRFAVSTLGSFDSEAVVKKLIGFLGDASYARRSEAASTLKRTPGARQPLMKELLACEDERQAWALAEVVLAHDRAWRKDVREELWKRLVEALDEREDRLYSPFVHVLREIDTPDLGGRICEAAEQRRKKKKYPLAARWLHLLADTPDLDEDAKLALAVCELKAHRRVLDAKVRRHDAALELLRGLAATAMPLADRLRKDRSLEPEELFYVGFNFAEGSTDERSLARELLDHLAGKFGRTKIGKAAKNKLALL